MELIKQGGLRFRECCVGAVMTLLASGVLAGSVSYQYDVLGRVTKVSYGNGTVITYTYDAAGNRSSVVVTGAP